MDSILSIKIKEVIIWGCGETGKTLLMVLEKYNFKVIAFADNNPSLQDTIFCNLPVYSKKQIKNIYGDKYSIIISNLLRGEEIRNDLISGGFNENIIYISDIQMTSFPINKEKYNGNNIDKSNFSKIFLNCNKLSLCKVEQYIPIYERLLSGIVTKQKPINLLEIGVQRGGSLEMWKSYLPKNSKIYGIDINKKCQNINFSENINFILGNASNTKEMNESFKNITLDVIIDDGSHISNDVIKTFEFFWNKLNYGGIYIIEDCHTSYWTNFNGGYKDQNSHIEYFKNLVDAINAKYIIQSQQKEINKNIPNLEIYKKEIASISFYDSIIVIEKYLKKREEPFRLYKKSVNEKETYYSNAISINKNTILEKIYRD